MELRPFVPGRHHPRFHVIPKAIERDVDRTDLLREIREKGPSGSGGLRGGRAKEDGGMAVCFRRDSPSLRQGDLLLERIAGSAAAGTHARHRLRLSDESAHVALDLGDRVDRIDAGHDRGMCRVRARDRLELRELGLLPAAHFLEGDFDPHLRHRGVRQVVEGQSLYDGPDRSREGVRLPPNLRGQGTRPPQNPMDFWMRPRGYQDLPLVARSQDRRAPIRRPHSFFAGLCILSGVQGGSPTMFTTASLTPWSCSSFRFTSWWMYAEAGHPGAVRVILTSILPSSGLRSMLYTRPRS